MRLVEDASGNQYELLKQSDESARVRDIDSGTEQYVQVSKLNPVSETGQSELEIVAETVPDDLRCLITGIHTVETLGLLIELVEAESLNGIAMRSLSTCCESELNGLMAELLAAGLAEETRECGERVYQPTAMAESAVEQLRKLDHQEYSLQ
ncbi:MAG: hypothetical protein J07HQX50_00432 [Haloquadratum sp. J07HQX50]|jgi:hypothetical protein|nr:MAG: hypothetical protein J07HQX50_00432 [Haloquadratum sp. J07HQX50]